MGFKKVYPQSPWFFFWNSPFLFRDVLYFHNKTYSKNKTDQIERLGCKGLNIRHIVSLTPVQKTEGKKRLFALRFYIYRKGSTPLACCVARDANERIQLYVLSIFNVYVPCLFRFTGLFHYCFVTFLMYIYFRRFYSLNWAFSVNRSSLCCDYF